MDESGCEKIGSAHSESIASDDARGNACLKKCFKIKAQGRQIRFTDITLPPEKRIDAKGHPQRPIVPVSMVGVPTLHIFDNLIFGEGPLSITGNDVVQSKPIHHTLTMVAHPAMGGMGHPVVNMADGLIFHIFP